MEKPLYEAEEVDEKPDPDEIPIRDRKLITQPYDLVVDALIEQIKAHTLHLRPVSERPKFQRQYVWDNKLASKLIESVLLNVPIPPCYLSQNEEFELDVIDGQQRIFSIYRYINNEFPVSSLEILNELNGLRFHQLPRREQLKLQTYTLRCVVITNDSHPEIKFDVFERLNTNTVPLNAQELRNCMFRGSLNALLGELSAYEPWLEILNRKLPDKRLRDEELILRFFAFSVNGVESYRTPQKHWLNEFAKEGRRYGDRRTQTLSALWKSTIDKCLIIFNPTHCFRRLPLDSKSKVINRALMDLTMHTCSNHSESEISDCAGEFVKKYTTILEDKEFDDLISRAVDHKSRTTRRFEMWRAIVEDGLF